ncbi:MAG: cupin domain-containing protein [Candidatus Daviesbacteria bacterium]|nr:cupin domain-containing protein [Candidatus Daviesbacteria bacterium]
MSDYNLSKAKISSSAYITNIEDKTVQNENFREVLFTGQHSQLVVMSLLPNEEIGMEVHEIVDQFLRIEEGEGKAILNGEETLIASGSAIMVPAGTQHNIINTSPEKKMKLYTVYSPAHHKDKTIHKTKQDALADTEDHI